MSETTVLYALSTAAQSCAALAAFVGAVGLYRLQALRDRHREVFNMIAAVLRHTPATTAENLLAEARRRERDHPQVTLLIAEYEGLPGRLRISRRSLIVFEVWNLLVVGASLVGFNHVPRLVGSWWMSWALWGIALGTAGTIVYCVTAWTTDGN